MKASVNRARRPRHVSNSVHAVGRRSWLYLAKKEENAQTRYLSVKLVLARNSYPVKDTNALKSVTMKNAPDAKY